MTRETLPAGTGICRNCNIAIAVWRCKDCILATPMCRACLRNSHKESPLHRIQHWNGSYFRNAELWEVGTYLLVRHHTGEAMCDTLHKWSHLLESAELTKDRMEQDNLRQWIPVPEPEPVPHSHGDDDYIDMEQEKDIPHDDIDDDDLDEDGKDELADKDDELDDFIPYLYVTGEGAGSRTGDGTGIDPILASVTVGSYHRVIHTNGLHHLAMVSCQCKGQESLPLDLFAAQLLPASLKRIKTLFTAQLLDMFRLSNLELKASAYQFYQLLRRLTKPMSPGEVPNLYREFRRMSRIWRWMKKLKWAGYAGSSKPVSTVGPGELAIFCPACPQVGINIPVNWKEDPARQVIVF